MASLSLYHQFETNLISNRNVIGLPLQLKSTKAYGKNYIRVKAHLVRHFLRNRLFQTKRTDLKHSQKPTQMIPGNAIPTNREATGSKLNRTSQLTFCGSRGHLKSFSGDFLVWVYSLGCVFKYLVKFLIIKGTIFKYITDKRCPLSEASHDLESPGRLVPVTFLQRHVYWTLDWSIPGLISFSNDSNCVMTLFSESSILFAPDSRELTESIFWGILSSSLKILFRVLLMTENLLSVTCRRQKRKSQHLIAQERKRQVGYSQAKAHTVTICFTVYIIICLIC